MISKYNQNTVYNNVYQLIFTKFPLYKQITPMYSCLFSGISIISNVCQLKKTQKTMTFTQEIIHARKKYQRYISYIPMFYQFCLFKWKNDDKNKNTISLKNRILFCLLDGSIDIHLPLSISFHF